MTFRVTAQPINDFSLRKRRMPKAFFDAKNWQAVGILVLCVGAAPPPMPTTRPVSPPQFIFVAPSITSQHTVTVRSCRGSKTYFIAPEDVVTLKNTVPIPKIVLPKGPTSTIMTLTVSTIEISDIVLINKEGFGSCIAIY